MKRISDRVINVDLFATQNVDIVANVISLPFAESSIDAIISESLLEHLEDPKLAIDEMFRVLKPGGSIYILTPFMLGFHSSPYDYYRWTLLGLRELFRDFDHQESGVAIGPSSAAAAFLREWFAMILSFGNVTLYQLWTMFFMIVLIPINWLDLIVARFSFASNISLAYYLIARKQEG